MNNFDYVFMNIKKQCKEPGIAYTSCFDHLVIIAEERKVLLPITTYLEVFKELGLIKFNRQTKEIILTEKGNVTDSIF